MGDRKRQRYTPAFKAEAVRLVLEGDRSAVAVGRDLGVRADLITVACYLISSCLAAVAGLILSGYVGLVDNWVGQGYELDSIVACVIGGVSLKGGRGYLEILPLISGLPANREMITTTQLNSARATGEPWNTGRPAAPWSRTRPTATWPRTRPPGPRPEQRAAEPFS